MANENTGSDYLVPKQFSKMAEGSKILLVLADLVFASNFTWVIPIACVCVCACASVCAYVASENQALKFSNDKCRSWMQEWSIVPQEVFYSMCVNEI